MLPSLVRSLGLAAWATALVASPLPGQEPVRYELSFPNRVHHEAEIEVVFADVDADPLEIRMSRTSPGRYALHEFAKNVYDVRITDGAGGAVTVDRPNPHQWNVSGHDGTVRVRYTLFGDRADGTYSGIDESHAHLNMPATLMWARGLEEWPTEVTFRIPEGSGWRVATQLEPTDDPSTFRARDLQYLMDSPTELSDFALHEWEAGEEGEDRATIRIALHHDGTAAEAERYAAHTQAIVEEERGVWGELPAFDHGTYTFLACYLPWVDGDGMEHRNSTILTSTSSLRENETGLLGTVAHEFFHAWNVERLRPRSLEPFDFEEANMSEALWFAEGFTSYYDDLALVRAGIIDPAGFAERLGRSVGAVVGSPGLRFFSPVEMSMQAPFVDAAVSVDPQNRANTFVSYYTWGSVLGLALDLELRTRFPGRTLDAYMRTLWERWGEPETPYTLHDLETALGQLTGDPGFAADFFARYVRGREVPDLASLLGSAGILLRPARPDAPWLGVLSLRASPEGAEVAGSTLVGSPLYEAGVDRGDRLLTVDGRRIGSEADVRAALEGHRPGDRISLSYVSRGRTRSAEARLAEDPALEAVLFEDAGRALTEDARALRAEWLASAVPAAVGTGR